MINIYTYLLLSEYNDEFVQTHSWGHVATFIISYCVQSTILLDSGYNMLNRYIPVVIFVVFSVCKSSLFGTQGPQHTRLSCPSLSPRVCSNLCPLCQWCHPTISSSVTPSPPALNLSQHQGLFQWVGSSHQMAKVLELQLQHQSLQWIFKVDFL